MRGLALWYWLQRCCMTGNSNKDVKKRQHEEND